MPSVVTQVQARAEAGPTGTLVVTNKAPSTATIIDVGRGTVLATLSTGQGPHEVVISRDSATAVVTHYVAPGRATSAATRSQSST